jgi:hypothetical protein
MELVIGPFTVGIDNVSKDTGLAPGAVVDAVNIDFDRDGVLERRPGLGTAKVAAAGRKALWQSPATGVSLAQVGTAISEATWDETDLTLAARATLASDDRASFCDLPQGYAFANRTTIGRILPDGTTRGIGVEDANAPGATPAGSGGMYAGQYAVAIAYLRGDEEGALSALSFVQVVEGGGILLALPQPAEGDVTAIAVYATQPNGEVLHLREVAPVGLPSYMLGQRAPGRIASTQGLARMPGGNIVRTWRGRLLVARGNVVLVSPPLRYGLYDPRHGFVQESERIVLLEPVDSGFFVGTAKGVVFYRGTEPKNLERVRTNGARPIPFASGAALASDFGGDLGASDKRVAIWLAENGFVVGMPDGSLLQPQSQRIRLTAGGGAIALNNRKVVAAVS